jgi:hypothetical protein
MLYDGTDEEEVDDNEELEHYPHKSPSFRSPRKVRATAVDLLEPPQTICITIYFVVFLFIAVCFSAAYTAFRLSLPAAKNHGKLTFSSFFFLLSSFFFLLSSFFFLLSSFFFLLSFLQPFLFLIVYFLFAEPLNRTGLILHENDPFIKVESEHREGYYDAYDTTLRTQLRSLSNYGRWSEVPTYLDPDSPDFFESMALYHVNNLVDIAKEADGQPDPYGNTKLTGRLTMTKAALDTGDYLLTVISAITRYAASRTGITYYVTNSENVMQRDPDLPYVLTYSNVSNVVVRLAPKDPEVVSPAVLISAHYDSVVYSPGASDNGGMVGVALEVLRALTHREQFDFPIIFLFDDAEEAGKNNINK